MALYKFLLKNLHLKITPAINLLKYLATIYKARNLYKMVTDGPLILSLINQMEDFLPNMCSNKLQLCHKFELPIQLSSISVLNLRQIRDETHGLSIFADTINKLHKILHRRISKTC